jgi:hypothetical protein
MVAAAVIIRVAAAVIKKKKGGRGRRNTVGVGSGLFSTCLLFWHFVYSFILAFFFVVHVLMALIFLVVLQSCFAQFSCGRGIEGESGRQEKKYTR